MRGVDLKEREQKNLPPEKLYEILRGIYSEKTANELFEKLTAKSEEATE